ncbi:MAG: hypothetical protein EAY75_09010 [Bacteroidetes bacterium]|nr:MAG: hypothetical protein EAY75_09010 [Bacteroidota bacterium]
MAIKLIFLLTMQKGVLEITMKSMKVWMILAMLTTSYALQAQSLSGSTWNVTVPTLFAKPYNFIFGTTGNKGNVLYPDSTLADFSWAEDGNGNWSIKVERMVSGVQKIETFYGKISGNVGSGFYYNTTNRKNLKPLTMVKK